MNRPNHTSVWHLVNPDTGEIIETPLSGPKQKNLRTAEGWYVCFARAMGQLAMCQPSRFALTLFVYLIGKKALNGNEIVVVHAEIANEFKVSRQYVHRHIRELVELNVLLEHKENTRKMTYRFNPRIAWNQTLDKRPVDLLPYPEIGKTNAKETRATTRPEPV